VEANGFLPCKLEGEDVQRTDLRVWSVGTQILLPPLVSFKKWTRALVKVRGRFSSDDLSNDFGKFMNGVIGRKHTS
jgi:hypothetical protein